METARTVRCQCQMGMTIRKLGQNVDDLLRKLGQNKDHYERQDKMKTPGTARTRTSIDIIISSHAILRTLQPRSDKGVQGVQTARTR